MCHPISKREGREHQRKNKGAAVCVNETESIDAAEIPRILQASV